jgi:hypothetical protein
MARSGPIWRHTLFSAVLPGSEAMGKAIRQIARVVAMPKGSRPFRVHIDPMHDRAEEVFDLGDKFRVEFFQRIGFDDLLHPAT